MKTKCFILKVLELNSQVRDSSNQSPLNSSFLCPLLSGVHSDGHHRCLVHAVKAFFFGKLRETVKPILVLDHLILNQPITVNIFNFILHIYIQ